MRPAEVLHTTQFAANSAQSAAACLLGTVFLGLLHGGANFFGRVGHVAPRRLHCALPLRVVRVDTVRGLDGGGCGSFIQHGRVQPQWRRCAAWRDQELPAPSSVEGLVACQFKDIKFDADGKAHYFDLGIVIDTAGVGLHIGRGCWNWLRSRWSW